MLYVAPSLCHIWNMRGISHQRNSWRPSALLSGTLKTDEQLILQANSAPKLKSNESNFFHSAPE